MIGDAPDSNVSRHQRTHVEATPEDYDPSQGIVSIIVDRGPSSSTAITLSAANAGTLRDQLAAHLKGRA